MGDINADGVGSGPGARARVRVRCSARSTERIGLWLELVSASDVRGRVRLNCMFMVNHG